MTIDLRVVTADVEDALFLSKDRDRITFAGAPTLMLLGRNPIFALDRRFCSGGDF
jgi:hypothetical protein